jgi:hypothetical protein
VNKAVASILKQQKRLKRLRDHKSQLIVNRKMAPNVQDKPWSAQLYRKFEDAEQAIRTKKK